MEESELHLRHKTHPSISQLTFIAESIPIYLNYLDKNERYIFINKMAADYWQLSPDSIVGKTLKELASPEVYAELSIYTKRVLRGETFTHEVPLENSDGTITYFRNNYIPNFNSHNEVIGFVVTGMDISHEKHTFDEAKKLAQEFKILADSMPQIVWTANPDGHVDYYNKRWYEFTGLPEDLSDNNIWKRILHPDDIDSLYGSWLHAIRSGNSYELEFRVMHKPSGVYRWLLSRARPVKDKSGKIIKWYGSNTDIHDQKLILQKLEVEQKLREQILYNLSHDLRTPLTAAKISAQMILRKRIEPDLQKLANRIDDNMGRADRMIQDLLDASMLKSGNNLNINICDCNIVAVARAVIEECSLSQGDRFQLLSSEEIIGEWDCEAVRRIIENLLNNAVKYSEPLTKIRIKITDSSHEVVLSITNFGIVIPANELVSLFSPYTRMQATKHIKGWGIGLSLVKGFTEAHHGTVSATSDAINGTTFSITLPKKSSHMSDQNSSLLQ